MTLPVEIKPDIGLFWFDRCDLKKNVGVLSLKGRLLILPQNASWFSELPLSKAIHLGI